MIIIIMDTPLGTSWDIGIYPLVTLVTLVSSRLAGTNLELNGSFLKWWYPQIICFCTQVSPDTLFWTTKRLCRFDLACHPVQVANANLLRTLSTTGSYTTGQAASRFKFGVSDIRAIFGGFSININHSFWAIVHCHLRLWGGKSTVLGGSPPILAG